MLDTRPWIINTFKQDRVTDKVKSTAALSPVSAQNINKIVITLLLIVSGKRGEEIYWLK